MIRFARPAEVSEGCEVYKCKHMTGVAFADEMPDAEGEGDGTPHRHSHARGNPTTAPARDMRCMPPLLLTQPLWQLILSLFFRQ